MAPPRQGAAGVGDDAIRIELAGRSEPAAVRTGTVGAVEGEHPRRDLGVGDSAVDAGVSFRQQPLVLTRRDVDAHQPVGETHRGLQGFCDAPAPLGLCAQAVDDDVDVVRRVLCEGDIF